MKKNIIITLLAAATLTSCGEYNKLLKSTDYEYKYEAAKNYFAKGQYNRSATLLNELITILKGTDKAEESLYMLGMSYYNQKDYQTAAQTFITYFNTYPRGTFTELARFHAGKALFLDTPEPRLDQSSTYQAIQQLQMFMEYFPNSTKKQEAQDMIFALQDKLVLKELYSARLYYNLGNYLGNNYESCVITAQNALKDYPYTDYREELSILILRARHEMAIYSVTRTTERFMQFRRFHRQGLSGIQDYSSDQGGLYDRRNRTDAGINCLFRSDRIHRIRRSEDSLRIAFRQDEQNSYNHG